MKQLSARIRWLTVARLCSLVIACHQLPAADVKTWSAGGGSLASAKTFRMLPSRVLTKSGLIEEDPEYAPLINAAIRREMALKGLKEVTEGEDIQVSAGAFGTAT